MLASKLLCCCIILLLMNVAAEHVKENSGFSACQPGKESCQDCYFALVKSLLGNDENVYNLSRVSTAPDVDIPSFVIVNYHFRSNDNDTEDELQRWLWAESRAYFLHPLFIFQFISLFFGNPKPIYEREVNVTFNATECHGVKKEYMPLLTQRVNHYTPSPPPPPPPPFNSMHIYI